MERSRKILYKIASASSEVVAIANNYADREDYNCVSRCHFQLEEDMRRISVACECLADILNKPVPKEGRAVDVRIQDWVVTEEPQVCLDTLSRMKSLLQQKENTSSWMSRMFRGSATTGTQDKIKEAVDIFNSYRGCFHLLFSTEIWNNESAVQRHHHPPQSRDHPVKGESVLLESRSPIVTQVDDTLVPLDPGVQGGHAEQGGPNIVVQDPPTSLDTTVQETVHCQDGHVVTQRSREVKNDKQREEEEKKLEETLKWLDGLNCAEKHDVTLSLRQEDTCKWLFDTTQYKMWRDGQSGSFWLRGKPGAGKSVLVSFVIDSLKNPGRRKGEILTFFYCDFRNERSTNSAEVMRSILSQLLRHLRDHSANLENVLGDLIQAKEWGGGTLSNAKELAGITSRAASLLGQKPLVIVDALDECKDVRNLIQALMMIRDHVRLFVSSRPLHIIVDVLSDLPSVSMEDMADELYADIELHVTRELDARQRLRDLDPGFKTEIRSVLCEKADGMFRWVQCSIDTLDRCVTRREVRNALDSLPKGLDETYERILLAIEMETPSGRLAQRALVWLVAAKRNLQLTEVMEALSINLKTRTLDPDIGPMHSGALLDACGSLVTYSEKTGIIILAHFSVKEYLVGEFTRTNLPAYHVNSEQAHLLLARSCMCYLSICLRHAQRPADASSSRTTGASSQLMVQLHPKSKPLLDYALDDALDHFGHLGSTFKLALHDVTVLAEDIQRHSWTWDNVYIPGRWDTWEYRVKPRWPAAVHDLILYILVAFASDSFMEAFLRRMTLKPKKGTNPLVYAAYFDKDKHARMLLLLGAGLNQKGWETVGYRQSLPIEAAFWNQNYAMVTLFVKEGSTVPSHIFTDLFFKGSLIPLSIPSSIVRLLLQTDEFVETINNWPNMTPFHAIKTSNHSLVFQNVAEQDLIAIMRRITQVADENLAPNPIREAFLRLAVAQGYFSAVRYLCTLGTSLPSDLLVRLHHYPGRWKTASMIRFLLENGADTLVSTSSGDSVLHAILWAPIDASKDDILEAVKLLVDLGCNPLEADSHGNTPLPIAIQRGYISVAQYLLTLGEPLPSDLFVKLNRVQSDWCTASMIRFLVENGVDPLVHTADGDPLLHIVLQSLCNDDEALEVVKVLVDYHCDPLEANSRGTTPVHIAVEKGLISVARHLVTVGAYLPPDLPVWKSGWSTALMIQFLVENHVNVLAHTSDGDSMLHIVLQSLYDDNKALEVVKLLVSYGCDPLEANPFGKTPLHIAAEQDYISVARYLLAFGSDISLRHELNMRPRMIRLLVENGVNVLAHSSDWANPNPNPVLHTTLQSIYSDAEALEVVKLLIGYSCDPLKANPFGDLLHAVVERGHNSAARYLLSLGIHPRPDLLIALNYCSWSGRTARMMIPLLVENGVDVLARTIDGETPLHIISSAVYDDNEALEAARVLIDYGCDPLEANCHGKAPLHIAIERGYTSVARYLISLGASLPPNLLTAFNSRAAARMIPFLVENGVSVVAHTRGGNSALHVVLQSSGYNDSEVILDAVRVLVDHGCDPFEANGVGGNTPLRMAVERGYISVAQYFISLGALLPPDVLVTSSWFRDTARMIHFLVKNGVNVLARTRGGDSALHVVLQSSGHHDRDETLEAVRVLVDYGCDPFEANARGTTPLGIAVEQGHVSVARYLTSLGVPLPPDLLITSNLLSWFWVTARMVHFLVENGVNVLAYDSNGNSALHIVLQSLHDNNETLEAVKVLVAYGCDPFEPNARGKMPLHIAVEQGHMSIARYLISLGVPLPPDLLITSNHLSWFGVTARMIHLLESGVNVLAHDGNGNSALHIVLQSLYNHDEALEAAKVLVAYGCNPLEANARGTTPLGIAVERGHISVAQYFVSLGAPLPPDLLVTLSRGWSCCSSTPMVRFLVENGVDVLAHADDGDSLLHVVLQCPDVDDSILEVATLLVSLGCDPLGANSCGNTPLHLAIQHNHISAARYLLTLGATLSPDLLVTLDHARSHWSTPSMIRFLVENGVDVLAHANDGDSVLHSALRCLNRNSDVLEVAKFLIGYGCDPLEGNSRGETPLHIAAERCQCDFLASYLITQGASVLTKAANGDTVLHLATRVVYSYPFDDDESDDCTLATVEFFVECGSDPAVLNDNGKTPLHNAVDLGHIKTIKYLLSLNNPLPPDILFTAIQSDQDSVCCYYVVQTLVTSGCDTQTPNAEGDTPLQVAIKKGKVDVVKYLFSVESVQKPPLADLLSAAALAPAFVQSEMRRMVLDRRARSESLELPPAKRIKHS